MAILNFSDVLKKAGLDPNDVLLIRHAFSDELFRESYKAGKIFEYTKHQKVGFGKGCSYWIVFIGDGGNKARLHSCYRVNGSVPDSPDRRPEGLPQCEADTYQNTGRIFDLEKVDLLEEYEGKIVIDWGAAINWYQSATNDKPISAIESKNQKPPFVGFENLILSFDELKKIVEDDTDFYDLWKAAMSAVNAVYLIVDTKTGARYVGSTYGNEGLLGRWTAYITTEGHGNNKGMIAHLGSVGHSCHDLQFSVLQVLSKALTDNQIIEAETLWKKKLLTYEPFGLNQN